jgi:hypothetical protein
MKTALVFRHSTQLLSALVTAGALFAVAPIAPAMANPPASTASQKSLPAEAQYGGIHYLTGGVGAGEAKAFEDAMQKYALAIELAEKQKGSRHDAFTAGAMVRISDHGGKEIFNAKARGPFMLVQLDPGEYSMTATLNNHTLHKREFTVERGKSTRETFVFPAGTD